MATKLLLLAALAVVALSSRSDAAKDDFDLLIFAQSWPVTTCIEWKERRDDNVCTIREFTYRTCRSTRSLILLEILV